MHLRNGNTFPSNQFLKTLGEVYEKVVMDRASGVDVPIKYEVFTKMQGKRTTINQDDTILFWLFDLAIPPSTPDQLIVLCDGCKYLRLDCLSG
jgi:hypothetical protein